MITNMSTALNNHSIQATIVFIASFTGAITRNYELLSDRDSWFCSTGIALIITGVFLVVKGFLTG